MRVLVYPHDLGMGGSQMNAIELAARVRNLGAETMIFGQPGVLSERIAELGVEFIESPDPGRRPSLSIARLLHNLARERRIDVLHGYEWPPALECFAASWGLSRTAVVSTVMSMAVAPFIPQTVPLVVGTEQIGTAERRSGRGFVHVLEPPVDLQHNQAPPPRALAQFRDRWGVRADSCLVVCVTRLAAELKLEGLLSAITAVGGPLLDIPIQLLIAGDGPARQTVADAARIANERAGRDCVVLTGELFDPRPAYASADIIVGMGGSALRALAFRKPLVVQGERGYFALLTPESLPDFLWQGWYGVGVDPASGVERFTRAIRAARMPGAGQRLGQFGRQVVEDRFSLESAANKQVRIYEGALRQRSSQSQTGRSAFVSGVRFVGYYSARKIDRLSRGGHATDDFNANPVAALESPSTTPRSDRHVREPGALVYMAGAPWHAVAGTDLQLATAVGRLRPVVWVDPPISVLSRLQRGINVPVVSVVAPGVTRVHPIVPPGVTRPVVRDLSRWWADRLTRHVLRRMRLPVDAVLASSPEPLLHRWVPRAALRIYFATDDFVAGADLLGMSRIHVVKSQNVNLCSADIVLAVSAPLEERLRRPGLDVRLFPNGCDLDRYANIDALPASSEITLPEPLAGIIGQLNERLDLDFIEGVVDRGVSLLLVGPRYEQPGPFRERLDAVLAQPNVQWVGRRPASELPGFMAAIKVGLTPYAQTPFNEASFPLKTLEYLAAGRQVVSSPVPANDLLDPTVVHTVASAERFGDLVEALLARKVSPMAAERCRAQAEEFSWANRAQDLESVIVEAGRAPADHAASPDGCSRRGAMS